MPLRNLTGTVITVPSPTFALLPDKDFLPMQGVWQRQNNWCWAACCSMVLRKLRNDTHALCEVAAVGLGVNQNNCCNSPNQYDIPLCTKVVYDKLTLPYQVVERTPFNQIQEMISVKEVPVEAYVQWQQANGRFAHVVIVNGWAVVDGVPWVHVLDPWYQAVETTHYKGWVNFNKLARDYRPNSQWTQTTLF